MLHILGVRCWRVPHKVDSLKVAFVEDLESIRGCDIWRFFPISLQRIRLISRIVCCSEESLIRRFYCLPRERMEWTIRRRGVNHLWLTVRVRTRDLYNFLSDAQGWCCLRWTTSIRLISQFGLWVHRWRPLINQVRIFTLLETSLHPGVLQEVHRGWSLFCILFQHVFQQVPWGWWYMVWQV